jgi:predicted transcriptional regulator YdeE
MDEPTIVERGQLTLLGFSFYGDPFQRSGTWTEENEIGRLWSRFMAFLETDGNRILHVAARDVTMEVHVYSQETMEVGAWEIFVGMEVQRLEDVPVELVVKVLPPCTYAVFSLRGEEIGGDWSSSIYDDWLPGSGYEMAHSYAFQFYDERFKGVEELAGSVLDVYIPVRRASSSA